eukprot:1920543-Amphidinium_carterae.1
MGFLRCVEDNLDDINLDDMELTELDHELFEPLNSFDDDLKELMINTVNEKVDPHCTPERQIKKLWRVLAL